MSKSQTQGCKHVCPSPDDHTRLTRLGEELRARSGELARILARNMGITPHWPLTGYRLTTRHSTAADGSVVVVMHEVTFTDGSKLCHDAEKQVSCSGPCPC